SEADDGQRRYLSTFALIWYAVNCETAKPRSACSVAASATSANDIVPQRSSAVHQACGAAGTTVRGKPGGICPPCRSRKYAAVVAHGYGPTPETCHVSPVCAM